MQPMSYARHRFPPVVIRHAVWLYLRFTLSYRDVEDLLAERDLEVTNETIRRWVLKFGPAVARNLRHGRPTPHGKWHLPLYDQPLRRRPPARDGREPAPHGEALPRRPHDVSPARDAPAAAR